MKNSIIIVLIFSSLSFYSFGQKEKYHADCATCYTKKVKASERIIYSEIIIEAPIEKVWAVLTDFKSMPEWSPNFQGIYGEFSNGSRIEAKFKPKPNKDKITVYEHNIIIKEGAMFGWKGDAFALGMRDNHQYRLEKIDDNTTKFIQSDECNKGMTWMMGNYATKTMLNGYVKFNAALKKRVEGLE